MAERTKGPRFYECRSSARVTAGKIQALLAEYGARAVALEYEEGEPVAVSFSVHSPELEREVAVQLRPNVEGVERLLEAERRGKAKAGAVAWRQVQELIVLKLEMIRCEVSPVHEAFADSLLLSDGSGLCRLGDALLEEEGSVIPHHAPLLVTGSP